MTELTPLARKLRTVYFSATTDRDDTKAWWNAVAETAEAELAAPRPVRLPTVEECHQAIGASCTNALVDPASVVLDLVASRPLVSLLGVRKRLTHGQATSAMNSRSDPPEVRVHLDATTLDAADKAAGPEDSRVELLAEELEAASGCCFDSWPCSEADRWYRDARLILARLDAVRADA